MHIHWAKKIFFFLFGTVVVGLSFRFTPYLFSLHLVDIQNPQFHSVKFYDRDDNLLQEVLSKNSRRAVRVRLEEVSPYFIKALLATEDQNFYQHSGVDYAAVGRAAYSNLASGQIVSGASTITLQLARLLQPAERTFFNKIKETYRAFRLEAGMSKQEILEAYVNRLPMSGNLYGIEGAARTYFGIHAADLTLAQATFLASIPNSPTRLNPYFKQAAIKKRQQTVLTRMAESDLIPRDRVARVLKENVLLKPQNASFKAPHFVFSLLKTLADSVQTVKTTIDIRLQETLQEQIRKALTRLKPFNVTNAAALLLDNETGQVLAYVGSADYFNSDIDGQVDGVQSLRQPGSTLKPFLYLMAMENGFNPATLLTDLPSHYSMPTGIYSPKNYSNSFHGPVRLREALANSLNVPAVRTLAKFGVESFLNRLHEYSFDSLIESADYYGVGLALGGGEVTLYELTRAYLCLARLGDFKKIQPIFSLNDRTLIDSIQTQKKIAPVELNYLIADILSDSFARTAEFGFDSVLRLPFHCSVKTGTSFRFSDNWTVGFTEDYTLGIWVGNFDHSPMQKVSGVSGAGPIFSSTMLALYDNQDKPGKPVRPAGLVEIKICPVSGKVVSKFCDSSVDELIPAHDMIALETEQCEFHETQNTPVFPIKFKLWAEDMGFASRARTLRDSSEFRFINPQDGAEFHRLPNLDPAYQSVLFELSSTARDGQVNWYLNGELIQTTDTEHRFLWQIEPGNYTLKAVQIHPAQQLSCLSKFTVQ